METSESQESGKKSKLIPKSVLKRIPRSRFFTLFFFAQGLVGLSGFFVFLSELDYF